MRHRPNYVFRIIVLMLLLLLVSRLMPDNGLQRQLIDTIISSLTPPAQPRTPRHRATPHDSLPYTRDTIK